MLVDPSKYQQNTVTVDGTKAWATCPPSDYLVTVTAMKKGTTEGTNLFLGSTALAGIRRRGAGALHAVGQGA